MPSATTPSIPLPNLGPAQTGASSNTTAATNNAVAAAPAAQPAQPPSNSSITTSHATLLPQHATRPLTWREKLENACSVANGVGTFALIAALVFGVGAWVGMKIQISQGGKNMELAIWTACADHEAIQDTKLCKSVMAKDFSQFGKRADSESRELTVIVKREIVDDTDSLDDEVPAPSPQTQSRISRLLASLSLSNRQLVLPPDHDYYAEHDHMRNSVPVEPAIRATIFPLVNLLVKPLSWTFDFIESILLLIVYCIHKLLSWMTTAFLFIIQAMIYRFVEGLVQTFLGQLDLAIWESMPSWMPYLLASNVASLFGLSALRSFWYSTNYLNSLKWIFIFRFGMWLIVEAAKGSYQLWCKWRLAVEQRRMERELRSQPHRTNLVQEAPKEGMTPPLEQVALSSTGFSRTPKGRAPRTNISDGRVPPEQLNNRFFVDQI